MARTRERYVEELADTVNSLFDHGNNDPDATEIAEAHFPGRALAGEIIESVRKRLGRVRDILEQEYHHPVYLLSPTYYIRFRHVPPQTAADVRRCIPMGQGRIAAGIARQTKSDDLLWEATVNQGLVSGAGKLKKGFDRTLEAVEGSRIDKPRAAVMIDQARRVARPAKPALAAKVMRALPKPKKNSK